LTLPSGLKVLHTPNFSTQALLSRILARLDPNSISKTETEKEASISVIELARVEGLAIGMTKELLESVEMTRKEYGGIESMGGVVRDDQAAGGTRWYRDIISDWHLERV
jgi:ESCRT-II complex subunit VPS36